MKKNRKTLLRYLTVPTFSLNSKGAGLMDGIIAMGVIGIGVTANMTIYSGSSNATRSTISNLSFSNVKASVSEVLHSKSTYLMTSGNSALKNCVSSAGTCANNRSIIGDINEPGESTAIASKNGVPYLINGAVAKTATEKRLAVYTVKITEMKSYCNRGEATCDLASEIRVKYEISPITSNYKILGAPSAEYFKNGSKIKPQFLEKGQAVVRISDFKISDELSTNLCGASNLIVHPKNARQKMFASKTPQPEIMQGIHNFSSDMKTATTICDNRFTKAQKGERGRTGNNGSNGYIGRDGVRGPRGNTGPQGYRGKKPGSYGGNWNGRDHYPSVYLPTDNRT